MRRLSTNAPALAACLALGGCDPRSPTLDPGERGPLEPTTTACTDCPDPPTFVGAWGERGTEPGQFVEPSSVELLEDGIVVVAGHENRIQRFTADGELIDIFGTRGPGDGQFNHPHGLAVDHLRDDLIYVGDQENHRLQVFDAAGGFVRQWGDAGFEHIHDVGIDRQTGDLFVGDYERHTLRRFDPEGGLLATLGGPGTAPGAFDGVWGVSTDSAGDIYVADTNNRRVQKLDPDGTVLDVWTAHRGGDFLKPTGVFVDHDDVVYVCDSIGRVIARFDTDGAFLDVWSLDAIVGYATEPEDIVVDGAGEHLYVAEVLGHSVLHLVFP